MLELILVAKTQPDWSVFLREAKNVLKIPLGKYIEDKNINPYQNVSKAYYETLTTLTNPADHMFYTFYILSTRSFFFQLYEFTNSIKMSLTESIQRDIFLAISTGSLRQWFQLIVECNKKEDPYLKLISNKLQNHFERVEGLYSLFSGYEKKSCPDTTYLLHEK